MLHPVEKILEGGVTLSRTDMGVIYLRSPVAGKIKRFALWFSGGSGVGSWKFDVRVAGVSQFPDFGDMLTLNSSNSFFDEIASLNVTVAEGTIILLDLRQITGGPITTPGTFLMEVDDEVAYVTGATRSTDGTLASNSDSKVPTEKAVKTYADGLSGGGGSGIVETIVAGTNVTVDDTDPANPIVSASGGGGGGTTLFSPDVPYGTPSAYDDEFDAGTLDGKWTPLYTFTENFVIPSHLRLINNTSSTTFRTIRQAAPAAQDSEWVMKVVMGKHESIQSCCGIEMRIADRGGYRVNVVFFANSSGGNVRVYDTSGDVMNTNIQDKNLGFTQTGQMGVVYLRCKYVHSTHVIEFKCSTDGITWLALSDWSTAGYDLTDVGVIWCGSGTLAGNWSEVDFFRKWQGAYVGGIY